MKFFINCFLLFLLFSCNGGGGGGEASGGAVSDNQSEFNDSLNPLGQYLWFIKNTGQDTFEGSLGIVGQDVNLLDVHSEFKGNGVYVAISDGRVDVNHEDILEDINSPIHRNYTTGSSVINWHGRNPTSTDDSDAHGTFIAGIIGARKDNSKGGFGIAPEVRIAGFNFLDSDASISKFLDQADSGTDDLINIFNYSYGASTCRVTNENATYILKLEDGVSTQRSGKGSIYITSSGNDFSSDAGDCSGDSAYQGYTYYGNSNFDQRKSYPYLITVAAIDSSGKSSSYSTPGSNVWISAPGGDMVSNGMVSTDLEGCNKGFSISSSANSFDKNSNGLNPECKYAMGKNNSGTSFAAPLVTGAVALILESNPNLGWRDVKHILASTATQVDTSIGNTNHPGGFNLSNHVYEQGWITNTAGFKFHNWYGFGRLNVDEAVNMAKTFSNYLPEQKKLMDLNNSNNYIYEDIHTTSIPDNSQTGASRILDVKHNYVIEAVQVKLNLTHPWPYQVGIELRAPSGKISILKNINSNTIETAGYSNLKLLTNAFYGESSLGEWRLKVVDGQSGSTGVLNNWSLNIWGHVNTLKTDFSAPLPVSNISHASSTFNLTSTPTITFSPSSSDDVIRYEASIGTSPGSQDVLKWKTIGTATSFSLTSLTLQQGTTYYVNLTAVDSSENVSDVESSSGWVAGGGQMAVNLEYTYSKPNTATSGTGGSHYTSYCNLNDTVWNTCNISTSVGFSKKSSIDSAFSSCSRSFNNTTGVYNITCSPSVNCYYESAYPCVKYCPRVNVYVNVGGTALDGNCTFNPP